MPSDSYKNKSQHVACLNKECDKIYTSTMNSCREIFDEIMLENLDRKNPRCRHLKGT